MTWRYIHRHLTLRDKPMKYVLYLSLMSISFSVLGQFIEVPAGGALTVQGNLNLPTGFSFQYNDQNYIKAPTLGSFNTYLGFEAGSTGTGGQNTFLGYQTGRINSSGVYNTFLGYQSGYSNTTGGYNVFIGQQAGKVNVSGGSNLFLGSFAGAGNINGSYNLFMGNSSGQQTTSGSGNTFIGDGAGYANQTGANNTYIGRSTGFSGNTAGTFNTFIGYGAGVNAPTTNVDYSTTIGVNAVVTQSNSVILGAPGANVGIGNSAPMTKLHITTGVANASGLRLQNLTSASPASLTNQTKFLTVNANGDVILGSTNSSARVAAAEGAGWEADGENLKNTNAGGVVVGDVSSTPAGYKLYVAGGVLTEKVKVAVKSTADWSDRVFDPAYRLRSLNEVDRFIQQNKHLPGIPSATEMVKQGNDLHKTDTKLLEKIEELTLYLIEQQKELKSVNEQNNLLNERIIILERKINP